MKFLKLITVAVAALVCALSCKPEETGLQEGETLIYREFSASFGDGTKTSMNGTSVLWDESGEAITIVDCDGGIWTIDQTSVSSDRKSATFGGMLPDKALSYAVYPASDDIECLSDVLTLQIPSYQNACAGSFDTHTNLTVAKISGESLFFKNVCSLVGITVNASDIQSIRFCATETGGGALTGPVDIDYGADDPLSISDSSIGSDFVQLDGSIVSGQKYWALVAPGEYTSFEVVFTDKSGRTATFFKNGSRTLERKHAYTISPFTITDKDWDDYVDPSFTLVTSASSLQVGDEVLIVYKAGSKAMSTISDNGYYRTETSVTISGNTIPSAGSATVLTLEAGASSGTWAFKDGSNYLASASEGTANNLVNSSTKSANASWTVSVTSAGLATVVASAGSKTYLMYNEGSPRFSCYSATSSQKQVSIYRRGASGSGGTDPVELSVDVSTGSATSITATSAILNGSWSGANASVREAGFHYGTSASNLSETHQADINPGTSGHFSSNLTLNSNTTYYFRAYVLLQDGSNIKEFTGATVSFTTLVQQDVPVAGSQPGWYELPVMNIQKSGDYMVNSTDNSQYYAWHISPDVYGPGHKLARNYTVCYSATHHCPLWVAAPRHSMYVGSANRTDAYKADPDIPADIQYSSKSTGSGCNKGHMLGSAERTCSSATNRQVFYYSNIAPQLSTGFNTGGGGWNILEDYVDTQVCADTLYEVLGCYFEKYTDAYGWTQNPSTISYCGRTDVSMPTMFYYVLLRTKSGNTGKSLADCSASELKCVAFVRTHTNSLKGQQVTSRELMSVSDLEKITGVTYFPNVPNAPKNSFSAADWGL